jgi:hypothetical protein
MLSKFRSFVRSFVQIIFSLPLCCRNSDRPFVRSFDRSSFVHSLYFIVLPDNLYLAVMLPKFRSFVRPIIRSFVRSFIFPIHRSSFIVHHSFIRTIHHHYSSLLFSIITIHRYYSSMIIVATFSLSLFIVTIHRSSGHPKFQLLIHHAVQST